MLLFGGNIGKDIDMRKRGQEICSSSGLNLDAHKAWDGPRILGIDFLNGRVY